MSAQQTRQGTWVSINWLWSVGAGWQPEGWGFDHLQTRDICKQRDSLAYTWITRDHRGGSSGWFPSCICQDGGNSLILHLGLPESLLLMEGQQCF